MLEKILSLSCYMLTLPSPRYVLFSYVLIISINAYLITNMITECMTLIVSYVVVLNISYLILWKARTKSNNGI